AGQVGDLPGAARRGGVLHAPAGQIDAGRPLVVELDVVVGVRGAGVAAAAVHLADQHVRRDRSGRAATGDQRGTGGRYDAEQRGRAAGREHVHRHLLWGVGRCASFGAGRCAPTLRSYHAVRPLSGDRPEIPLLATLRRRPGPAYHAGVHSVRVLTTYSGAANVAYIEPREGG